MKRMPLEEKEMRIEGWWCEETQGEDGHWQAKKQILPSQTSEGKKNTAQAVLSLCTHCLFISIQSQISTDMLVLLRNLCDKSNCQGIKGYFKISTASCICLPSSPMGTEHQCKKKAPFTWVKHTSVSGSLPWPETHYLSGECLWFTFEHCQSLPSFQRNPSC